MSKHTRRSDSSTVIEVSRPMADDGRQMVVWRMLGSHALRVTEAEAFDAHHTPYSGNMRVWTVPDCCGYIQHSWLRSGKAWRCSRCGIATKRGRGQTVTHWARAIGEPWQAARGKT